MRPGVAFLLFQDESEQRQFDAFVWRKLQEIEDEYDEALRKKRYVRTGSIEDYFIGGWSKASEIKAWHLYEQFKGRAGLSLLDKLPDVPRERR